MNLKKRLLRLPHFFFIILILVIYLIPGKVKTDHNDYLVLFLVITELVEVIFSLCIRNARRSDILSDVVTFIFIFLLLWTLATEKFQLLILFSNHTIEQIQSL